MPPIFYFQPFDFHADTREPDKRLRFLFIPLPIEVEDKGTAELINTWIVLINVALLLTIGLALLLVLAGVIPLPFELPFELPLIELGGAG